MCTPPSVVTQSHRGEIEEENPIRVKIKKISVREGFRILKTTEGCVISWTTQYSRDDLTLLESEESEAWKTMTPQELVADSHNWIVDLMSSKVPLTVLLLNTMRFFIPRKVACQIRLASVLASQSSLWVMKHENEYVFVSEQHKTFMRARISHFEKFLVAEYSKVPTNIDFWATCFVKGQYEFKNAGRAVQDLETVTVYLDGFRFIEHVEPEKECFHLFRDYVMKDDRLVKRQELHKRRLYCVVEQSYGREVFVGKAYEDTNAVSLDVHIVKELEYVKVELNADMFLCEDEDLKSKLMKKVEHPPMTLSKMDPALYKHYLEYYDSQVKDNHEVIVKVLMPFLKGPIIVPCDGLGTWARLWPKDGLFSDLNGGYDRCKQGTCLELLKEAEKVFDQGTIILMYCLAMLSADEKEKVESLVRIKHFKLLVIDTTRQRLNVILHPINNLVSVSDDRMISDLEAFQHDTSFTRKTVHYSNLLLEIESPFFPSSSIYSEYWQIMKPLHNKNARGKNVTVCATLAEWLVFRNEKNPVYLASAGIHRPEVHEFMPHKRLFQRQIYQAAPYWYNSIPSVFEKIQTDRKVYFVCTDVANARVRFESANSNIMVNMMLEFYPLDYRSDPLEDLSKVMVNHKNQEFTCAEFLLLAQSHSVFVEEAECLYFLETSPSVKKTAGKKKIKYSFQARST
jgi:hypothetical protein